MSILTRRFIIICLLAAILAMLAAHAVANSGQDSWVSAVRFCSATDGPSCLLTRAGGV